MTSSLTCVLQKARQFVWEKRSVPDPQPDEVQIKVIAVGICGSDLHYWWNGRTARFIVERPLVLGHESAGQVVQCGAKVKNLKPGDRVALEPGIPCRRCFLCKTGKYNICEKVQFHATPPEDGTLSEYVNHPEDFCYKLPDFVTYEEGALLEPLTVAVHSCRRAEVGLGSRVLITGAGPIGQVSVLTARAMGASQVFITDINDGRLTFAKELGATGTVNVLGLSPSEVAERISKQMGGQGPTSVLECSGADSSLLAAIEVGSPGCIIVTVGRGSQEPMLPACQLIAKEMEIRGIFRYANCYGAALSLLVRGDIDVKSLISHRFKFPEVEKAFVAAKSGVPIKVMINVADQSTSSRAAN